MSIKRYLKKKYIIPLAIVAAPIVIGVFILVGGGVVMLLWNWLLPPMFGLPEITVWQGFGLLALCRILFGGFGSRGGSNRSSDFSPEDRERFRQRMRERFGCASDDADAPAAGDVAPRTFRVE
jgi:hypothetical protein